MRSILGALADCRSAGYFGPGVAWGVAGRRQTDISVRAPHDRRPEADSMLTLNRYFDLS
jgi:hypothetical protein